MLDTIQEILLLQPSPIEIIVIDQNNSHPEPVSNELSKLVCKRKITHIVIPKPSITRAMNLGLMLANSDIVLFVDDDIRPEKSVILEHLNAHANIRGPDGAAPAIVAGRVLQPWQEDKSDFQSEPFHFAALQSRWIDTFMGCNVSMNRKKIVALGGFDENFIRVAYNFESELAYRAIQDGGGVYFEPAALIHHLKISDGGTRSFGDHLTTIRPDHAVGAYYFILRSWRGLPSILSLARRPLRSVTTRHHARRPWFIPITIIAEFGGLFWAIYLAIRGPRYCNFHELRKDI